MAEPFRTSSAQRLRFGGRQQRMLLGGCKNRVAGDRPRSVGILVRGPIQFRSDFWYILRRSETLKEK